MFKLKIALIFMSLCFVTLTGAKESKVIDLLESLDVNGTKQSILLRSENTDKPIVLFVHGGPGSPLMYFSRAFDDVFLKDFIIVHWDQRYTGKSYDQSIPIKTFTVDQIAQDGLVIVDYLKKKFNKSKILLVGHSWGSIVGGHMAKKKPEAFLSFISVGTVADMHAGDKAKYSFLENKVKEAGTDKDKKDLLAMGAPPWKEFGQLAIQSSLMAKYKGSFYALSPKQLNQAVNKNTEYSEAELRSLSVSMEKIWHQIFPFLSQYKAAKTMPSLDLPVVFAQGDHDMATPTYLAKEYFKVLEAPKGKIWIEFRNSAHFPMYEEPEKFLGVLKKASGEEL